MTKKTKAKKIIATTTPAVKVKKYPPPRVGKNFAKYWNLFIDNVTSRDNFKEGHLEMLKILCDLYVQQDDMLEVLQLGGMTYESEGRNGTQIKIRPEQTVLKDGRLQILSYSTKLGLLLTKDTVHGEDEDDKDSWS